ncbi:hypothetical protein [Sediminicola sp. 1XM1-17]|uniref:hypothetical protein n=1 Tax=Sediminicola sp. 1XM1-17 TaxID=3127702 RepID=UPI0030788172
MCKISEEIKLCSCATHMDSINNMWRLKSYTKPQIVFGEYYPSLPQHSKQEILNHRILLDKLNSKNLFDFEYEPQEGDLLEISICVDEGHGKFVFFTFYHEDGKWTDRAPFCMDEKDGIKDGGYIKNGI